MELTFRFPVKEKEEICLEESSEEILERFEDEIIFWLEDGLSTGGEDNEFNLLLDLCEILGKDFDDLELKNDEFQYCEFLCEEAKRDLLRSVVQEKMTFQYDYPKRFRDIRLIHVLCEISCPHIPESRYA